jgi:hypothetical protein
MKSFFMGSKNPFAAITQPLNTDRTLLLWLDTGFAPAAKDRFPPLVSIDMNGPLLQFRSASGCFGAARRSGHSLLLLRHGDFEEPVR